MKLKRFWAIGLSAAMILSLAACGGSAATGSTADTESSKAADSTAASTAASTADSTAASKDTGASSGSIAYKDITLGTTGTDIKAELKFLTNRTDMLKDDYAGTSWAKYLEAFNKDYPNIKINVEGVTDYASDTLLRLQGGDWGDIMMIPAVAKADLATYFLPFGTVEDVSKEVNYINSWQYDGKVYGIPITANAQGIVYNKKIFTQAGITTLPDTPDKFIEDLKAIKEKTSAIPLYTNYAAGWTLGAWDAYISGGATGDAKYMNQELLHTSNPFKDPGDGTKAYNVYKILYDAVANGYTEDDYTTTDWEGSKGMMNNGQVATMVLGSWAVSQMQQAGDNASDVGYMPFPMTVNGKRYASAGPDYNFGINVNDDADKQTAAMIFVKWMTEKSGFSYNEGGLPIAADDTKVPDLYSEFTKANVVYVSDEPAVKGEEDLLNTLNADSELNINNGGNDKVAALIEHAANKDEEFSAIMDEWNEKWTSAQETEGVKVS